MKKPPVATGERYDHDVAGMPCFSATAPFVVFIGRESMRNAVPADDENCAIALGCRAQLVTPYASVGRYRADVALPHPEGVRKTGFGNTLWAVVRFKLSPDALAVVIAADRGQLANADDGVMVQLNPPRPSDTPSLKRKRNTRFRESKGVDDGRGRRRGEGQDALTVMGVRNLTGQRKR